MTTKEKHNSEEKQPSIHSLIAGLLSYSRDKGLLGFSDDPANSEESESDQDKSPLQNTVNETYMLNQILNYLDLDGYIPEPAANLPLPELLEAISDYQIAQGKLKNSRFAREQFETGLIALFAPKSAEILKKFQRLYQRSPQKATDWFFTLNKDLHYIKEEELAKDIKWKQPCKYGEMEITINLSKPEKDPLEIKLAARQNPSERYPKCAICKENEGYQGNPGISEPRQNLRLIPITLNHEPFYLQYSPYQYFDEHCIVLHKEHKPMVIDENTFRELFDFVDQLDHYLIGSNADLPIVGGSILSHHHFQGGRHIFPIEKAKAIKKIELDETHPLPGLEKVLLEVLYWPTPTLRLSSENREELLQSAMNILEWWKSYDNPAFDLISQDENGRHNTITPIVRKENGIYHLYLLLRNNRTSKDYPDGLFHVHPEFYDIKKENLGLIEVAGLAVLPARLNTKYLDQKKIGESFEKILECTTIFPFTKDGENGEISMETSFLEDLLQYLASQRR